MAHLSYKNYSIRGISAAVPASIRKSMDFSDAIGKDAVDKFIQVVGVIQGHVTDATMTTSDLCACAALNLLNELKIERDSIDVLIFVSQTPDYVAPSTACVLQYRLGLSEDCLAYDINLACSGFVYGMSAALSYIQTVGIQRALLLCGDTVSKHCSPEDRGLMMLSTDAGTATLIDKNEVTQSRANFTLKTMGKNYRSLIVPYGGYRHRFGSADRTEREPGVVRNDYDGYMNGSDVFKFSITEVPKLVNEFYARNGICHDDFTRCFLHQANLFIMKHIAKRIGVEVTNLPISIDRYGNTGSATIPLTICDHFARKDAIDVSEKIVICGFGIGLSLGVGIVEFDNTRILPIAICEDFFDDNIDNLHNETKSFVAGNAR